MKKKISLVLLGLLLIVSLFLTACTKSPSDTTEPDTTDTEQASEEEAEDLSTQVAGEDGWIRATDKSKIPASSKKRTDTIIVGMGETQGIFNPIFYSTTYDRYVNDVLFSKLVEVDLDGGYIPAIAKSWDISEDGLTYTFHLRDDVHFSDGTPLTAKDVEFTYHVYLDPTYDGQSDLSKAVIKGTDAYKNGDAERIEGITIVDDHTIQIDVEESRSPTLGLIGALGIVPKHYYGENYSKGNLSHMQSLHQKPLAVEPMSLNAIFLVRRYALLPTRLTGKAHQISRTSSSNPPPMKQIFR